MKVSVIVVTLNSGNDLVNTVENIEKQTFNDYEIVIKDGGSTDGSLDRIRALGYPNVFIVEEKDSGIYDAMNSAVEHSEGEFVIFINAGDSFYSEDVLKKFAGAEKPEHNSIVYGDTYFALSQSMSKAPSCITGSVCYRNIPCHQAIFYSRDLLLTRQFDTAFKIRADYEHFLWAFYEGKSSFAYLDFPVCSYQGGGFSESRANRNRDKEEYKIAVRRHIPLKERMRYRFLLIVTLHKLRGILARNKVTAKYYQKFKSLIQK